VKLILIKPSQSTFIRLEERILRRIGSLTSIYIRQDQGRIAYAKGLISMCLRLLFAPTQSIVLIWFADYHSALATAICSIRKLKTLIFVGGYDAVSYPELGMGVFTHRYRSMAASYALRRCSLIVSNHEALIRSSNTYYNPRGHLEGVQNLVPKLSTPCKTVYNAVSYQGVVDLSKTRQNRVIAIGTTPRFMDIVNKGYDLLFDAAKSMPDIVFIIVGIRKQWHGELQKKYCVESIHNLQIVDYLPQAQLIPLLETSKVFVQASISEGMPNALMEAMLCGCIPVGSQVSGIPTVIGEFGYLLDNRDPLLLQKAIKQALISEYSPHDISSWIKDNFSFDKRLASLRELIENLSRQ
jgi:glycosyltransferase involved in cell wall biosynthesis